MLVTKPHKIADYTQPANPGNNLANNINKPTSLHGITAQNTNIDNEGDGFLVVKCRKFTRFKST